MTSSKPYCAASFDMPLLSERITVTPIHPPRWSLDRQKEALRITHTDLDRVINSIASAAYHAIEYYISTLWGDHTVVVDWLTEADPADEPEFFAIANLVPFISLNQVFELEGGVTEVAVNPTPTVGYRGLLLAEQFSPNTYYRFVSHAGWTDTHHYRTLDVAVTRYVAWIIDTQGSVGWNGLIQSGAAEMISLGFPGSSE